MFGDVFANRTESLSEQLLQPEGPPDALNGSLHEAPQESSDCSHLQPAGSVRSTASSGHFSGDDNEGIDVNMLPKSDMAYLVCEEGIVQSAVLLDSTSIWNQDVALQPGWEYQDEANRTWDPWTRLMVDAGKTGTFTWRTAWCFEPRSVGWWIGFTFLLGSLCFMVGSGSSVSSSTASVDVGWWGVMMPYSVGGVFFTIGSALLVYSAVFQSVYVMYDTELAEHALKSVEDREYSRATSVLDERSQREVVQCDRNSSFLGVWQVRRAVGEKVLESGQTLPRSHSQKTIDQCLAESYLRPQIAPPWALRQYWLELIGSITLFIGVINFNIMVATGDLEDFGVPLTTVEVIWLDQAQAIVGGACFFIGGYLYWVSAMENWSLLVWRPRSIEWWIAALNLLGGFGFFFAGTVTTKLVYGKLRNVFVANAPELFMGYFIGSTFYAAQSYLMILEISLNR
ncbi:hypothetical protein CYMTET_8169 [Cymbomonas tetramitiformis]|uniref:Uncharacterized protein n=1 Tax=Cymbomonas tetramitiformis TaxID=36881 RepID=A0AAE0LGR3_9CHLO|nr:hypothetical protein CYMTET_8169 [Cymbomonas tetramitiformis]